jgi:hypothetical protein
MLSWLSCSMNGAACMDGDCEVLRVDVKGLAMRDLCDCLCPGGCRLGEALGSV